MRMPVPEYEPDFITPGEERELLRHIAALELREARYKQYTARRRIASFGAGYDFDEYELTPAPGMPAFLVPVRSRLAQWAGIDPEAFGYALVAEYREGTPLGWHRDAPPFGVVAGVSLGTPARMRFRPYPHVRGAKTYELVLEPRSAYLLRGAMRWNWQHSIPPTPALRYSITFRTAAALDPSPGQPVRGE
jgi:alkylated DNA repair dioxygenase AlkB